LVRRSLESLHTNGLVLAVVDSHGRVLARSQERIPGLTSSTDSWRTLQLRNAGHTIILGFPWEHLEREFRARAMAFLALSGLLTLAAAAGAWLVVGNTLTPISRLARQAQVASAESFELRLTAPSDDAEVVELVTTLNGLLERLDHTVRARSRFYAAASHELRTPLQALLGHLEVALSRPRSAAEYQAVLVEAHEQAAGLSGLVQALLVLNQLDLGTANPLHESVDLADVCDRCLSRLQTLVVEKQLRVSTKLQDAPIEAAPAYVEMLVRNLLENAVKYSAGGGLVQLRLCTGDGAIILEVFNECRPQPEWQVDRWCEPFFRPDANRTSATGGNGLGLTICRAVCQANGWDLSLQPLENGIRAIVHFGTEPPA